MRKTPGNTSWPKELKPLALFSLLLWGGRVKGTKPFPAAGGSFQHGLTPYPQCVQCDSVCRWLHARVNHIAHSLTHSGPFGAGWVPAVLQQTLMSPKNQSWALRLPSLAVLFLPSTRIQTQPPSLMTNAAARVRRVVKLTMI